MSHQELNFGFGIETNQERTIPGLDALEQADFLRTVTLHSEMDHVDRESVNDWETNGIIVHSEDSIVENIIQSSKFQDMVQNVVLKSHQRIRHADEERQLLKAATDQLEQASKELEHKIHVQDELERKNRKIQRQQNGLKAKNQRLRIEIEHKEKLIQNLIKHKNGLIEQSKILSSNIESIQLEVNEIGKVGGKSQMEKFQKLELDLQIDLHDIKQSIDWSPITINRSETQRMKETFSGLMDSLDKLKDIEAYRNFLAKSDPQVERPEFRLF